MRPKQHALAASNLLWAALVGAQPLRMLSVVLAVLAVSFQCLVVPRLLCGRSSYLASLALVRRQCNYFAPPTDLLVPFGTVLLPRFVPGPVLYYPILDQTLTKDFLQWPDQLESVLVIALLLKTSQWRVTHALVESAQQVCSILKCSAHCPLLKLAFRGLFAVRCLLTT